MAHEKYFKRCTVYRMEADGISIVDVHDNNSVTPLDTWMGVVVSLADGQHTVAQLIQHLASQYQGAVPDNLAETVDSVIQRLTEAGVIALTDEPTTLPYYLDRPIDEQDPKLATDLMVNDGFLRPPS